MPQDKYTYFETLFRDNYSRLYFYVLNLINDTEHAENIVDNVFAQVWEKLDSVVKEDCSLLPLLYALARNGSVDYLRHCEAERGSGDSALAGDGILAGIPDDDVAEHWERVKTVKHSVQALPPQIQKAFKACFLDGKKYREAGDELGVSVDTVKSYIIRSLSFIRKAVNPSSEK